VADGFTFGERFCRNNELKGARSASRPCSLKGT
jgi:hypothetical protein